MHSLSNANLVGGIPSVPHFYYLGKLKKRVTLSFQPPKLPFFIQTYWKSQGNRFGKWCFIG